MQMVTNLKNTHTFKGEVKRKSAAVFSSHWATTTTMTTTKTKTKSEMLMDKLLGGGYFNVR
jgi:phage antirepressor YoqD-like protein